MFFVGGAGGLEAGCGVTAHSTSLFRLETRSSTALVECGVYARGRRSVSSCRVGTHSPRSEFHNAVAMCVSGYEGVMWCGWVGEDKAPKRWNLEGGTGGVRLWLETRRGWVTVERWE